MSMTPFRRIAISILGIFIPLMGHAGCAEGTGQCYHYAGGQIVEESACKIVLCDSAAGHFFNEWTLDDGRVINIYKANGEQIYYINDKPGYRSLLDFKDPNFDCYGVLNSDELYCKKTDVW